MENFVNLESLLHIAELESLLHIAENHSAAEMVNGFPRAITIEEAENIFQLNEGMVLLSTMIVDEPVSLLYIDGEYKSFA